MNKLKITVFFSVLFMLNFSNGYAQQDSLVLYTNPGCSNCHAVKQALQQSGIYYIEKSLDNHGFATEMLTKLSNAGYHDKIFLPVIFLNNKLYHPAYKTDIGLASIALSDVVDSIKNKFRRGELNLQNSKQNTVSSASESTPSNSDCELKASTYYLIYSTYNTEPEAKVAMKKLITEGYIFAGIVYSQNQYKVFCKSYYDATVANSALNEIKKMNNSAYLFEMP